MLVGFYLHHSSFYLGCKVFCSYAFHARYVIISSLHYLKCSQFSPFHVNIEIKSTTSPCLFLFQIINLPSSKS